MNTTKTNPPNAKRLSIWQLIWRSHRSDFLWSVCFNLVNAIVGVATIALVNHYLQSQAWADWYAMPMFALAVLALLLSTLVAQLMLTKLGHRFVFRLRTKLTKQILDTPVVQLERLGNAKLLASLSTDIQSLTVAFVRLPELVQGVVLCVSIAVYLAYLSLPLTLIMIVWVLGIVLVAGWLVRYVYAYLEKLRLKNDKLYQYYQSIIDGKESLKLNRHRAKSLHQDFGKLANDYRQDIIKADTYHLSAVNWSNIMMFASIGLILWLAAQIGIDMAMATTFCLTILFLQTPLLKAIGAYPVLQSAQVALDKVQSLQLADYTPDFHQTSHQQWQSIDFCQVGYGHLDAQNQPKFSLQPIDFTLNRGEVVFLIGANGSGKTTFAKILTGLYTPSEGEILLDGSPILDRLSAYQQMFAAIFSDFYLFDHLLGDGDLPVDDRLVDEWLERLQLHEKISIQNHHIDQLKLSQGQKKRLALLMAIAENKPILLLDEWAADQDPVYRRYFYQHIIPLLKQQGKTLIVISHDDRYFMAADRLLMMKNGQLHTLDKQAVMASGVDELV